MIRAYKYKLKPTMKQRKALAQAFGNARFIYNWGLQRKKEAWDKEKKTISYFNLTKELTELKKQDDYKWLKKSAAESLQQALRCLDNAYVRFFRAKKGFPKFKNKKDKNSVKYVQSIQLDFGTNRVSIPKIGKVKFCKNQEFSTDVKIGTLTVTRDNCGDYWCTIVTDDGKPKAPKAKVLEETAVGIDLGIKDYAILSDGTKYGNPKFLEKGQKRLAGLQRGLANMTKGSNRRERRRLQIAKLHKKITNHRSDFLHKLSTDIIKRFDTICLENLNINEMKQNSLFSNAIQSTAWAEFVRQLGYKSDLQGKNIIFIGKYEPSTKTCSHCGYVNKSITLSDREWVCPICGKHHDRDINAAMNIKKMALHPQSQVTIELKKNNIIPSGSGIMDGSNSERQDSKSLLV